jgi:hypothetical protein
MPLVGAVCAASHRAKVAGFVRYANWTFTALLAASALLMIPSHRLIAATIGASAVVFAYAFLVIEPGTTRKGFPRRAFGASAQSERPRIRSLKKGAAFSGPPEGT